MDKRHCKSDGFYPYDALKSMKLQQISRKCY